MRLHSRVHVLHYVFIVRCGCDGMKHPEDVVTNNSISIRHNIYNIMSSRDLNLQLLLFTMEPLAHILALHHRNVCDGCFRASFAPPHLFQIVLDVQAEPPGGEAVHHRVQEAVEPHQHQGDLVGVVKPLPGSLVPVHSSPAQVESCKFLGVHINQQTGLRTRNSATSTLGG